MISLISKNWSRIQINKQNITRDTEMKNKPTVPRGEGGQGTMKEGREESSKNMYKGHMDKAKGGRIESGRWGWVGQAWL